MADDPAALGVASDFLSIFLLGGIGISAVSIQGFGSVIDWSTEND
jgi:hypothetical protein